MFAAFRLPEQIVTDNGPQFMYEVPVFLRYNAVQHVKTPPYHSASNGAAQRLVQTVMKNLVRQLRGRRRSGQAQTIQNRLDQFLFTYRNTLCSKTGKTPGETFFSCEPRTRLSTLHPELAKRPKPTSSQDGDKGQKKKVEEICCRRMDPGEKYPIRPHALVRRNDCSPCQRDNLHSGRPGAIHAC